MTIDPRRLIELYRSGTNIMAYLREARGQADNDSTAILTSYDLQAGSYVRLVESDPAIARTLERSCEKFAQIFARLGAQSLLEAGVGEATTLAGVVARMPERPAHVLGFDISLSRLLWARHHAETHGVSGTWFTGNLDNVPLADSSVDIVFTSHALEPNRGREREILVELHRVARRYVVLREPSDELGSDETRAHIERHRYVTGLAATARELGFDVVEHALWGIDPNPRNAAALLVIRKSSAAADLAPPALVSPVSRSPLVEHHGSLYCADDGLVFPRFRGVPCLLAENGVFASQFATAPLAPSER
jgi:ubiquinone/menaquinone biosynthesis C-methylase UbiE/uncharacterized protein YbaR (Trm112 family)